MSTEVKSKNKAITIVASLLVLVICFIGIELFIMHSRKTKDVEYEVLKTTFEINTPINLDSFNIKLNNGTLVNDTYSFDSSSVGHKSFTLNLLNEYGYAKSYDIVYNIVDTQIPSIENLHDIKYYIGTNIEWDKVFKTNDNSNQPVTINVKGNYSLNEPGEYKLTLEAIDHVNNINAQDFTLTVLEKPYFVLGEPYVWDDITLTTSKGFNLEVIDGIAYIEGTPIINKTFSLPSTYGNGLTEETNAAFELMKLDATALGLNIYNASGYRTYSYQNYLYNNYISKYGQEYTDTISARPGFSEHQSGLAIDLNTISFSFADTEEGIWVLNNAHNYGFIIRYVKDKSDETGYAYEPWHIRYVGIDLATKLYNNGDYLTMEDYFGIDSVYPASQVIEDEIESETEATV